jgi:hypothetical protein
MDGKVCGQPPNSSNIFATLGSSIQPLDEDPLLPMVADKPHGLALHMTALFMILSGDRSSLTAATHTETGGIRRAQL